MKGLILIMILCQIKKKENPKTLNIVEIKNVVKNSFPSTGSNLSAHQQMSGSKNYGTFIQWNSTQQREGRSLYPLQHHGWN